MKLSRIFLPSLFSVALISCHHPSAGTPPDFAFVLRTSSVTPTSMTLNTFDKTLQRVSGSYDTTIAFALTPLQLDTVYLQLREMDFFSLPEYVEPEGGVMAFPSPWTSLKVRANGVTKRVSFGGSFTPGVLAIQQLKQVSELLLAMVQHSREYRALRP